MRARGMLDLRDIATALYFVKINSVVSSIMTFVVQACATLAPYTKDMAAGSIRLGGVLLGKFLGFLQMSALAFPKRPCSAIFLCASSHLFTKYSLHL